MNERFKQIAQEVFFDESTNGPGQKMYMFGELKMQKFAELIVRECADIAEKWYSDYPSDDRLLSDAVKQHFGVEE